MWMAPLEFHCPLENTSCLVEPSFLAHRPGRMTTRPGDAQWLARRHKRSKRPHQKKETCPAGWSTCVSKSRSTIRTSPVSQDLHCRRCGRRWEPSGARFCPKCGARREGPRAWGLHRKTEPWKVIPKWNNMAERRLKTSEHLERISDVFCCNLNVPVNLCWLKHLMII